jgi:hypothetical protein
VLFDPYKAAQMALAMYQSNGNTLRPWGGYKGKSNTYNVDQSAIDAAKAAAQSLYPGGYGDVGGGVTGYPGGSQTTSISHTPMVFNMTFHVTAANGTDTEALARNISTKVQDQLQRAQAARR